MIESKSDPVAIILRVFCTKAVISFLFFSLILDVAFCQLVFLHEYMVIYDIGKVIAKKAVCRFLAHPVLYCNVVINGS